MILNFIADKIVFSALNEGTIDAFKDLDEIKPEVKFGDNTRFDFLISKKISKKNNIKSARSTINSICKLNSFNFIKLFSIKVKNVTNPTVRVKMNITIKINPMIIT